MKQIDDYVNSIYKNVEGSKREIRELKEEMRTHLMEAVHELTREGKTKEEAIAIALERFGDEGQLARGLLTMFTAQKIVTKWLLRSSLIFLIIGLAIWLGFHIRDERYRATSELMDHLVHVYDHRTESTGDMNKDIGDTIRANKQFFDNISYFAVMKIPTEQQAKPITEREPSQFEVVYRYGTKGLGQSGTAGQYGQKWFVEWDYKEYNYKENKYIFYSFFIIFGVLFTSWIAISLYQKRRLKLFKQTSD